MENGHGVVQPEAGKKMIGIMGGIGSGKSTAAKILSESGACVIDADQIGHEVLKREETKEQLRANWGNDIWTSDGEVDRKRLGQIVFDDPSQMKELNRIVHPRLLEELQRQVDAAQGHVVIDAALLEEFGLSNKCDCLLFLDVSDETRLARCADRGWNSEELQRREGFQTELQVKKDKADFIIDNNGPLEHLRRQIQEFWEQVKTPPN
jgi:dephospho-CoA kinase